MRVTLNITYFLNEPMSTIAVYLGNKLVYSSGELYCWGNCWEEEISAEIRTLLEYEKLVALVKKVKRANWKDKERTEIELCRFINSLAHRNQ